MATTPRRVVLVAPLVAPVRPAQLGGAQGIVCDLATGLARGGDDVEVICARGSRLRGVRLSTVPGSPFVGDLVHLELDPRAAAGARSAQQTGGEGSPGHATPDEQLTAFERISATLGPRAADVVHSHAFDWQAFRALDPRSVRLVHTLHLPPLDGAVVDAVRRCAERLSGTHFVVPSRAAAAAWRRHAPVEVVPNGADPAAIRLGRNPARDLAVVPGRISPEKGTDVAIRAARLAGLRVLVVGDAYHRRYFDERVAPLIGDGVSWMGPQPRARLARLLGGAAVAVVAAMWEEPFGMVALESALAGTPVAGFATGGLPEVVGPASGVLTEERSAGALARAVSSAAGLDRPAVRRAVEHLSLDAMVDGYRSVYEEARR